MRQCSEDWRFVGGVGKLDSGGCRMALWIWILRVCFLLYRMVFYSSTRTQSIYRDSFLRHFVGPNCRENMRDCLDFSFFSILAARTHAYPLAAWVPSHFLRPLTKTAILKTCRTEVQALPSWRKIAIALIIDPSGRGFERNACLHQLSGDLSL
jgi:hypothetical protein